jgi:neutral ceramidase
MARTARSLIRLLPVLVTAGCGGGWYAHPLPVAESPPPAGGIGQLRAGFGRADVTPPPGVGLGGNGPEGQVSTGYRHRLYVRALLLEDPAGERIALVVADQPHISANLHRLAAERLLLETGVGADRLIVSATHTHSGTSHFYGERQLNGSSSRLEGYDPAVVDLLVNGIVRAVRQAADSLRPARAAWGFVRVPDFTRNRSYPLAYCENSVAVRDVPCRDEPGGTDTTNARRAVDNEWKLLRIDRMDASGVYRPAGAYSVFAIHGTANPSTTTLLDGDIHAVVERRLERRIDRVNGKPEGFATHAVHVFANGAEGDVSPNRPRPATDCPLPALRAPAFAGPRAAVAPWQWQDAGSRELTECFAAARAWIDAKGAEVADTIFATYEQLGARLTPQFFVRRAFTTERLPGRDGLCGKPVVGTSTAAGASDVPTRVAGWRILGFIPAGFEQGGHAALKNAKGCQGRKRILLGGLQSALIVGEHGLPDAAQLSLLRLGEVYVATVPAEPTTVTARLIRDGVRGALNDASARVIVVSHTNGFLQYVTTREEYAVQTYEGGSTLYGPGTADFLVTRFAALAPSLLGPSSPPVKVAPLMAYPGDPKPLLPDSAAEPRLAGTRRVLANQCLANGGRRITWLDEPPGRLAPHHGQVLELLEERGAGWTAVAWDDQSDVVVEAVEPKRVKNPAARGYEWSVALARRVTGPLRLRLLPRGSLPDQTLDVPACTAAR